MWKEGRKKTKYLKKSEISQARKGSSPTPKGGLCLHEKQLYYIIL